MSSARMLVVDDDPRNLKLVEGYLLGSGYEVYCAIDGPSALALAREKVPDVVLLDVMMPGMTGYEVCRALKGDPRTRLCQVMLVTALGSTSDRVEGLDTGADDHVAKPVRRDEFLAKVRALLRARLLLVELEEARSALAARNEELQLKKTLAQTLVHDLKSPLSAILGNLDLLELKAEESLLHLVQRSKQGAGRMLKMILNLLDVEALDAGRLVPTQVRTDLCDLIRATLQEAETAAAHKDLRLRLTARGPVWLEADPSLMRRVIDNLVSNALTHAPSGTVVEVTAGLREEGVEVSVSDAGPGIPKEHRERIFEKYAQVKLRQEGMSTNRGLGLTFCRLAVEAHGGSIWVEEAAGGGSCFRIVLPAPIDAEREEAVAVRVER